MSYLITLKTYDVTYILISLIFLQSCINSGSRRTSFLNVIIGTTTIMLAFILIMPRNFNIRGQQISQLLLLLRAYWVDFINGCSLIFWIFQTGKLSTCDIS